jgi:hypothetical protein
VTRAENWGDDIEVRAECRVRIGKMRI